MQFYLTVEFQHAKLDSVYADDINSNSEYFIILWSIWACDPMKQFNLIEKSPILVDQMTSGQPHCSVLLVVTWFPNETAMRTWSDFWSLFLVRLIDRWVGGTSWCPGGKWDRLAAIKSAMWSHTSSTTSECGVNDRITKHFAFLFAPVFRSITY